MRSSEATMCPAVARPGRRATTTGVRDEATNLSHQRRVPVLPANIYLPDRYMYPPSGVPLNLALNQV